jgi:hypothetical protein
MSIRNVTVTKVVKVECKLTADQWQLYTTSEDESGYRSRDNVANILNSAFENLVNQGLTKAEVEKHMEEQGLPCLIGILEIWLVD